MRNMWGKPWWAIALRGLAAIVIGIILFAWPKVAVGTLIILFGIFAIVHGIFAAAAAVAYRKTMEYWVLKLIVGLASIIIGIVCVAWPKPTALVIVYVVAAYALIIGVLDVVAAITVRKEVTGEWVLILIGVLSAIFGIVLFIHPWGGAALVVWLIALYFVVIGVITLIASFLLLGAGRKGATPAAA